MDAYGLGGRSPLPSTREDSSSTRSPRCPRRCVLSDGADSAQCESWRRSAYPSLQVVRSGAGSPSLVPWYPSQLGHYSAWVVAVAPDTDKPSRWHTRWATALRYALLGLLPTTVTASSGFAGASHGQARANLIYVAILCTALVSGYNVYKEAQAKRAQKTAAALATVFNQSGAPLVTLLAKIAAEKSSERLADVKTLIGRSLAIAHSQCGGFTPKRCTTRAVFYYFVTANVLKRYAIWEGRQGRAPREGFNAQKNENDSKVVEIAKGENWVLIRDVDKAPPAYFIDYKEREYKAFLMVPVRAGKQSYGFLTVDSDEPSSLTKIDAGYVTLMAGLIGAALALVYGDAFPMLDGQDNNIEMPTNSIW